MKGNPKYLLLRWASSVFMMLMLVWLTVSTPFVTAFQIQVAEREKEKTSAACTGQDAADCNPFANTTEEKTESGSLSFSEEYLHNHHHEIIHTLDDLLKHGNSGHSALYIAFHGELLSPPPEV